MNQRHTEFFGPDLGRGPFTPHRIETAALQIATALAQIRAPLSRSDDDVRAHITFIRELADRLAPDWAAQIDIDVGEESANIIVSSIRAVTGTYSLLEIWLADAPGGGVTTLQPGGTTWQSGVVLETVVANRHWRLVTPHTGVAQLSVTYSGVKDWYLAIARQGRVYYSSKLNFF